MKYEIVKCPVIQFVMLQPLRSVLSPRLNLLNWINDHLSLVHTSAASVSVVQRLCDVLNTPQEPDLVIFHQHSLWTDDINTHKAEPKHQDHIKPGAALPEPPRTLILVQIHFKTQNKKNLLHRQTVVEFEAVCSDLSVSALQDILAYQRRSTHRLAPGLYLGYLKLSSSVDQIKVLVSQRTPNMLCHTRIRDNTNVSRYISHTHTHTLLIWRKDKTCQNQNVSMYKHNENQRTCSVQTWFYPSSASCHCGF